MTYYLSVPEPSHRVSLFRPKQPNDKIFPDVDFITSGIHWIKCLLACVTYKGMVLSEEEDVVNVILEPEWGIYNRCFYWAYEIAKRKMPISSGFFVAKDWTYGRRAQKEKRDFVNYKRFGELLNDIVMFEDSNELLNDWDVLNKTGKFQGELRKIKRRMQREMLGVNLSHFPIAHFLKLVKPSETELSEKDTYAKRFISTFIGIFAKLGVREIMRSHSIFSYIRFICNQLEISSFSDLREKALVDVKVAFEKPEEMEPHLSDRGYDAFLLLSLMKDNPIFVSYLFQSYMDEEGISLEEEYMNLREEIASSRFKNFLSGAEKLFKEYKKDFHIEIPKCEFERMAAWWEFNQFLYFMEELTWKSYMFYIDGLEPTKALEEEMARKRLESIINFLKSYHLHHSFYEKRLVGKEYEALLQRLDSIEPKKGEIVGLIKESLPRSRESRGAPMFMGLGSFRSWCRDLLRSLQRGVRC